ncbi:similar to Saccharomyces cerevisiae YDR469W SDC1 Subunit of the COMPASS (Set1C) complex, which methylates lysine 4 of histone H3 and is required in chromatin silencing at telomeres [Maudiozyma saulgeensis]|uniref:Similar to Saccharomyces cerevisiae YDR469W SDC1 Subunit of the COMPASS (Set1C) complex, which methylates lysine 4 of histone H3 and is required in chromatin silencing at telomeres n=1 Tax=Maudiozyma saulgeensis TaxID=1789683 RepID=A0A1X7R9A9_9SACH|nr:similar to Saccharomyces cerevisiae YDR469W SDC1 Subunit of the COMPASS (Set1C) complex, which methylates lysine 4 of histone H3 and is required in chromatin silencing at telomeres [Kazachstania saulgeensis]
MSEEQTNNTDIGKLATDAQSIAENTNIQAEVKLETPVAAEIPTPSPLPSLNEGKSLADIIGGSQVRRYLNENVTPYLLQGMRDIANEQPNEPLRVLGEYLIKENDRLKQERQ